jgi:hypothetical protein
LGEASSKLASTLDITRLEPLLVEVFNLKWWCGNYSSLLPSASWGDKSGNNSTIIVKKG